MTIKTAFETWNESRRVIAASDVPSGHEIHAMGVDITALHEFVDGAWIAKLTDGTYWSIVQFDEISTSNFSEAAEWLWTNFSSDTGRNS